MVKEILISIHIPKAGGMTLSYILKEVYGDKFLEISDTHSASGAWEYIEELDLQKIDCIHGHFPYGIHRYFPENIICNYMTFLREPVERLMSEYYFNKVTFSEHPEEDDFGTQDEFIQLILNHGYADLDNGMTRIIRGLSKVFTSRIKRFVTETDYKIALENLSTFYFVGITENFKSSLETLAKKLSWGSIPKYERIYYYPNRLTVKDLLSLDRKKLEGSQIYDLNLWKEAKRINEEMLNG